MSSGKSSASAGPSKGTCKWFNLRKGYGFLLTPDGQDVFVHVSNLRKDDDKLFILPKKDGGRVDFEFGPSNKEGQEGKLQVLDGTKIEVIDRYVPEPRD